MSSHDHDQLLVEGAAAGNAGSGRSAVRGTRRTATRTEEKAAGRVPTQRTRTQKATPKAVAVTATPPAARAKTPAAKPSAAKTTAAKATAPNSTAKPAAATTPAKTATAAKTTAAKAPAKTTAAKTTAAKAPAKTTAAKATAAKATPKSPARRPATPKPAAADSAPTAAPARPRPRPTPRPRAAAPVLPEVVVPVVEEPRRLAMAERLRTAGRRVPPNLRRLSRVRPPAPRRRPLVYVAALMAGGLTVGLISAGGTQAQAAGERSSVSVARELGVSSQRQLLAQNSAPRTLQDMVASRAQRESEQTAAAQTQQQAVAAAAEAARPKAVLPVPPGYRLTTCYCMRWGVMHEGIDLAEPMGTPEYAAMDGVVLKAGPASGFGQAVYIQHQNGDVTIYGHMEKILVQEGQVVHAGDTIALMGSEGQSTGPHLHFEVHLGGMNGPKTDPIPWLAARGVIV